MQREVDGIIREAVESYDGGAIDEGKIAAFGLVLELFYHAVAERRAEIIGSGLQAISPWARRGMATKSLAANNVLD
jgi:hypothetical protein